MNSFIVILPIALCMVSLAACQKSAATNGSSDNHKAPAKSDQVAGTGDAVQLKAGRGLSLHAKIKQSIGLKVAEVSELPVASEFTAQLHVTRGVGGYRHVAFKRDDKVKSLASGWLTENKAKRLRKGLEVELRVGEAGSNEISKGVIVQIQKTPFATLGDYEVVVATETPFDNGTQLNATFRAPAGEAAPAVPRSALLKTVEGWFVYTVNENFYLRTAVQVGAMNGEFAEITDGLYTGDQIVTAPVNTLWMSELQILRGGKSCTCGH